MTTRQTVEKAIEAMEGAGTVAGDLETEQLVLLGALALERANQARPTPAGDRALDAALAALDEAGAKAPEEESWCFHGMQTRWASDRTSLEVQVQSARAVPPSPKLLGELVWLTQLGYKLRLWPEVARYSVTRGDEPAVREYAAWGKVEATKEDARITLAFRGPKRATLEEAIAAGEAHVVSLQPQRPQEGASRTDARLLASRLLDRHEAVLRRDGGTVTIPYFPSTVSNKKGHYYFQSAILGGWAGEVATGIVEETVDGARWTPYDPTRIQATLCGRILWRKNEWRPVGTDEAGRSVFVAATSYTWMVRIEPSVLESLGGKAAG